MTSQKPTSHKPSDPPQDAVALIDDLLDRALAARASDVHFEPGPAELTIKFRLDGVLNPVETLPQPIAENIVTRLKVLAHLLTYRNDIPQEGRIQRPDPTGVNLIEQRLAIFPTIHGQRAVIRLFYQNPQLTDLAQLGFSPAIYDTLIDIAAANSGVLLLTGPAGSGKSTTLAAILRHILKQFPGKSIVALEDPVERHIPGVTQVQIPPAGEMTFPVALRSLLRQDPEVLMIGEIRDAETARIAIEAGLTGHLLMSTMHSGSPAGALLRLLEMGIEPYQVTSAITAVLNQRLLRRLCPQCKQPTDSPSIFQPAGCPTCFQTGYHGRVLIAEIVKLDGQLRQALLQKTDLDQLQHLLTQRGHMTLKQDAQRLINQGLTTPQEQQKTTT